MTKRLVVPCLILLAITGDATAAVPAWCKVDGASRLSVGDLKGLYTETGARDAVGVLVAATCYPNTDTEPQTKQIEATRQVWSKRLEMIDADWADAAAWAHQPTHMKNNRDVAVPKDKLAWSAYSPIDQYSELLTTHDVDRAYLADAFGAKLTEVGRFAYLKKCVGPGMNSEHRDDSAVRWALCAADVAAFDKARFATELRADSQTHDGIQRMLVRFLLHETLPVLAKHAADVKALHAKDPAYAKVFALADATRKAWSPTASLVELVTKMDDARETGSRSASAGCEDTTWAAWKSTVGAIPLKQFAGLTGKAHYETFDIAIAAIIGQPNGYLAALAVYQCGKLTNPQDFLVRVLGTHMKRWPGFRGPRTAAQTAILTAGIVLDDRDAKLEFPDVSRTFIEGNASAGGSGIGALSAVKIDGAFATVTFAKEKITQTVCAKGHSTNRITQIRPDGVLVYEYVCTEQRTETIEYPPSPPRKIQARYALGLAPGMVATVVEEMVTFVHAKGKSPLPIMIAGVGVK